MRWRTAALVAAACWVATTDAALAQSPPGAPRVLIVHGPADGTYTRDSAPVFAFVADRPATFSCVLDEILAFACASPLRLGPLADGAHVLAVAARGDGLAGAPERRRFAVDTVAPDTRITAGPPDGATIDDTPEFAWEADDAVAFRCTVDEKPIAACPQAFARPIPDGRYRFSVAAVDAAGNVDPTPARRSFTLRARLGVGAPGCDVDADVLELRSRRDVFDGFPGSDIVHGLGGNDTLNGRRGNDCLYGGRGNDRIRGGTGNDRLSGGSGADRLSDASGRDRFYGGSGNDRIDARDRTAAGRRQRDVVSCGRGRRDVALVDRRDRVWRDCERVRRRRR